MKKITVVFFATTLLGLGGLILYEHVFSPLHYFNDGLVVSTEDEQTTKDTDSLMLSSLIEQALAEPQGEIIIPETMDEIRKVYQGINMVQIPRIFVGRLPDDFQIQSVEDKTLFMKIVVPLILRTNERIVKERQVLLLLNDKLKNKSPWTDEESSFFNKMVEKYDAVLMKSIQGKMDSLIEKVDIIPVSVGVAQAILFTNWGTKNKESIFGEYGWKDRSHYEPIIFSSLTKAADSYAVALNSWSQLLGFRQSRRLMRPHSNNRSIGWATAHNLNNYMSHEENYGKQLQEVYSQGKIADLDQACFESECVFEP